jgi:hypothetical protein
MKDSKTSLRRSLPERKQSEPLQQTLHLRSLIEWWQLAQHPDFTLDIQEWEHASPGHQTVFVTSKICAGFIRPQCNSNELGGTGVEAGEEPTLEPRFREIV